MQLQYTFEMTEVLMLVLIVIQFDTWATELFI